LDEPALVGRDFDDSDHSGLDRDGRDFDDSVHSGLDRDGRDLDGSDDSGLDRDGRDGRDLDGSDDDSGLDGFEGPGLSGARLESGPSGRACERFGAVPGRGRTPPADGDAASSLGGDTTRLGTP
jgi:hypothetical protein